MSRLIGHCLIALSLIALVIFEGAASEGAGAAFKFGVDARALSMGGAFVSIADNYSAAYWNPAGIAGSGSRFGGMFTRKFGLDNIYLSAGGIISAGSLALGSSFINQSVTFETVDTYGNVTGTIDNRETLLIGTVALMPWSWLSIGANLKYYSHTLAGSFGKGVGFDIGFLAHVGSFSFGAASFDLGDTKKVWTSGAVDYVKKSYGVGLALQFPPSLTLAAAAGADNEVHLGGEFQLGMLSLRGGIRTLDGKPFLTLGIGLSFETGSLDVAYLPSPVGSSWVFSGEYSFSTPSGRGPLLLPANLIDQLRVFINNLIEGLKGLFPPIESDKGPLFTPTDKWAVVIGIADYENTAFRTLNYSDDDARLMARTLISKAGFPANQVTLLTNGLASRDAIKQSLSDLSEIANEDDLIVVFYAGHGTIVEDKDGDEQDHFDEALVPFDARPGDETSLIIDDELGWWVDRLKSEKVIVILDSCYSGGSGRTVTFRSTLTRAHSDSSLRDIFSRGTKGRILMAASKESQLSHELPELGQGVFTYFLAQSLEERSDANQDGVITVYEAFRYTKKEMLQFTKSKGLIQTPVFESTIAEQVELTRFNATR